MKNLLLLLSFFTLTATAAPKHHLHYKHIHAKAQVYVYICNGPESKRYHSTPDCRGLSRCSTAIEKVTLEEAEREGRTPCHICE